MDKQTQDKKRSRLSQAEIPRSTLRNVVGLAESLQDNFAGKDATPIDLAQSLHRSPTSSTWRFLTGAAVAYGLTDNAYGASSISLTSLGRQIVSPTEEGLKQKGLITALLRPTILKNFYEKYNKAKFPKKDIAKNVLNQLGVPLERTEEALKIVIENAEYASIMTEASGNKYIQIDSAKFNGSTGNLFQEKSQDTTERIPASSRTPDGYETIKIAGTRMKIEIPSEFKDKIFNESTTATAWHIAIKDLIAFAKKEIPESEPEKESSEKSEKETPEENSEES